MDKQKASVARKNLRQVQNTIDTIIGELIAVRQPLTPGKVNQLQTRCGKAGCKCTRGETHRSTFLYVSRGGPLTRIYLPKGEIAAVTARSERYRRFRSRRAELTQACKTLVIQVDELEKALHDPYRKKTTKGKR